ncbi:MAG: bifunctional phosphopantothenoylcysteine decarboxylase/phosphopantothenate--cysteine ligase CoaBC [Bacteroidetes bacterium]|nr:MAG: bifunctional phosphopantothenoylcysteine decarboxylase/phosphopantothenate--cysteine ligase CoaBC [Bacteroidota bacterium]TAG86926.1 MAG: bifunctional phosphopantothenoylcysteine decarboxylase/phosphopantothenate--cysteine ligase CoaBC [Bacteroidota bacterium]
MNHLENKKIILVITAGIAAYKAAFLVRLLVKQKAEIKVLMTENATEFITPLTLSTLSKNPVLIDFVKGKTGEWNNHVDLGLWADVILFAPATADTLAKSANGICDNLVQAVYLSAKCPVIFSPAMDLDMYKHQSTQNNLQLLQKYGNFIIPAGFGELASGLVGEGRMAEPEEIVKYLDNFFAEKQILQGKTILITAGATQEPIDPVRYITNHSTGKMGYAFAEHAANLGAKVILVSGKVNISVVNPNIILHKVTTAQEMYEVCQENFEKSDWILLAAAVADYKMKEVAHQKIKKKEGQTDMVLTLVENIDIAATLGKQKKDTQLFIGFALETNNEIENAKKKIIKKNFDVILLNSLQTQGAGFATDTNEIMMIDKKGEIKIFPLQDKKELARKILIDLFYQYP